MGLGDCGPRTPVLKTLRLPWGRPCAGGCQGPSGRPLSCLVPGEPWGCSWSSALGLDPRNGSYLARAC